MPTTLDEVISTKRTKNNPMITFRVDLNELAWLDDQAKRHRLSRTSMLNACIEFTRKNGEETGSLPLEVDTL